MICSKQSSISSTKYHPSGNTTLLFHAGADALNLLLLYVFLKFLCIVDTKI